MSEVKRYVASYTPYEGLDLNGACARYDGDEFVMASDFDAERLRADTAVGELATITADRDAEKDMKAKARMQRDKVTKRLADAERRNATLETELRNIRQSCVLSKLRDARIDDLLTKPTESGASE